MQIPTKIQHGEKVIGTVFEKINGIIDYLNASKLRKSSGIDVRETPSGTVLELVQKSASAPQAQQRSAVASGLEATVSDGTATVEISGSTALVIKPGANIQISGGTNGELIISATGGGGGSIPDWTVAPAHNATLDPIVNTSTMFTALTSGYLQIYSCFYSGSSDPQQIDLTVEINGSTFTVYTLYTEFDSIAIGYGSAYSMPIAAGSTVTCTLTRSGGPFYPGPVSYDFSGTASIKYYT